jgi:hypothetical protein
MAASDYNSRIQFHASKADADEFMRSPAMHVGTKDAARGLVNFRNILGSGQETGFKTHALAFSKHAVFHDETLSDEEANEAHARFLEERGITPSGSVRDSRASSFIDLPADSERRVTRATAAMGENKIVSYENSGEAEGTISHVVPTPHMNMRRRGKPDPQTQPVLPMDYSTVNPSKRTAMDRFWV